MNSLVSIVVPIYNAEKYLSRCIESIINQTYKNIEILLINDGSTDSSLDICFHYKSIDDRIIVIDNKNEGVSSARNHGIKLSDGKYIGFVDSDDYIESSMYENLVKIIEKDNSQAAVLTPFIINIPNKHSGLLKKNTVNNYDALCYLFKLQFPTSLWAYLYRSDIVKENLLNEEIHFFEDFEFNVRILLKIKKISLCHDRLYNYLSNEGSANNQKINEKRLTCLKIYDVIIDNYNEKFDRRLRKRSNYFRANFLIAVILSLSKSYKDAEDKYYTVVHENAKSMIADIIFSLFIPIKYKIIILMCAIDTKFTSKIIYQLKYKF